MREEQPELFAAACDLERECQDKRVTLGKDPVYFTYLGMPLAKAIAEGTQALFASDDDGSCESGYCFT
jgi:hypothetical protein